MVSFTVCCDRAVFGAICLFEILSESSGDRALCVARVQRRRRARTAFAVFMPLRFSVFRDRLFFGHSGAVFRGYGRNDRRRHPLSGVCTAVAVYLFYHVGRNAFAVCLRPGHGRGGILAEMDRACADSRGASDSRGRVSPRPLCGRALLCCGICM